ncbi:E3 ubiquitin-protein ligase RNF19B-like isoform X2 [Paramacrobiotus metropolitanus]|nr:E3 ubiquitin-protein ligase RNF19B-like isoform X2 [Paramacrobiotus metropolitanus]
MNKRQTRPSSSASASSCSKKSLTDSSHTFLQGNSILSTDNTSMYNGSISNGSIGQRGLSTNNENLALSRGSAKHESGSISRILPSQSENNIRKSNPSLQSSSTKERRNRDRLSLRNFISRTLFPVNDGDGSSSTKAKKTNTASSTEKETRKGRDRKSSTASSRSSPNALQVLPTPTSSVFSSTIPENFAAASLIGLPDNARSSSAVERQHSSTNATVEDAQMQHQKQCSVCYGLFPTSAFPVLDKNMKCKHSACLQCYRLYLTVQITESRIDVTCPECDVMLHPNDIQAILDDPVLLSKYEQFMIRRVLASEVDTRWCPAPDCGYAVIAAGCAECPRLVCEREECGTAFCYHCAGVWHPVSTCDEARAQRFGLNMAAVGAASAAGVTFRRTTNALFSAAPSSLLGKIKPCPRCKALIAKMDDGSCNHMTCTICGADFCWLCMKEISDLHFLSPTGCTFWGKKPWSRKKKLICQLGTLIGAPVGIALVAGVAIPSMIIGIPIWVGRKIHRKMTLSKRYKRNLAIASGVTGAVLLSPAVAALVVGFGVPLMLAYVYGVVPFSLCRNGGTCRFASNSGNSIANSTSNLSSENAVTNHAEDELSGGLHLRNSSLADTGSLDIITQQLHGSKSPDEHLMLRMMMVLDENDVVFVNHTGDGLTDSKSVSGTSARIRHRAEINHNQQVDHANASIGEFSMDSCDVHSRRNLVLLDPSGHSIADVDSGTGVPVGTESGIGRIRLNTEGKPSFDSASALALHLSARRQSASSDSVNYSMGDRVTLETLSTDLEYLTTAYGKDTAEHTVEQDNASTKALAGSIIGHR